MKVVIYMKLCEVDKTKLAPMMQHYVSIKENNPDTIILYRLGDFYEMFFEDAELVSHELELTLTGRNAGLEERVPMCGVPYHAVEIYIDKLIKKGYKVAICEQLEDPKNAKGIVKRDITEVISSGSVITANSLNEKENNYIAFSFRNNPYNDIFSLDIVYNYGNLQDSTLIYAIQYLNLQGIAKNAIKNARSYSQ